MKIHRAQSQESPITSAHLKKINSNKNNNTKNVKELRVFIEQFTTNETNKRRRKEKEKREKRRRKKHNKIIITTITAMLHVIMHVITIV